MKVMCIVDNGFEELECIGTVALLRRGGVDVDIYAVNDTKAMGRFEMELSSLKKLENVNVNDYDAILIPGGPHYAKLEKNEDVKNYVKAFDDAKKYVCAICAGPTLLGKWGFLKNKNYVCFTSMNEDFGGTYVDQYAVRDDRIITGRSAAATIDFGFLIMEALCGKEHADKIKASIYY